MAELTLKQHVPDAKYGIEHTPYAKLRPVGSEMHLSVLSECSSLSVLSFFLSGVSFPPLRRASCWHRASRMAHVNVVIYSGLLLLLGLCLLFFLLFSGPDYGSCVI
jgi:hypothetical protein